MEKILVSACLCGLNTRYDGGHGNFPFLEKLRKFYEIVPFCPEVEGGLKTPRTRAEIIKGQVMTEDGQNVTKFYNAGAEKALNLCHFLGIRIAILNDKSPSCGSRFIHDGSFKNNVIEGLGVTARTLIADGIKVYSDKDALEFLLPEEDDKDKKRTNKHLARNAKPRRSFKKDEGEEKQPRKRTFKKDFASESTESGEKKPFRKRSFEKIDGFKKDERKPYRNRDGEKSFGEKKSYGKKSYGKSGERKSFDKKPYGKPGEKKSYGKKPYGKTEGGKSFGRKPAGRKPFGKKSEFKGSSERKSFKK